MRFSLALFGLMAACAPFPSIDAGADITAAPPQLIPLAALLAQADGTAATDDTTVTALQARQAALAARAARLRGPVHDASTRDRLAQQPS